MVEYKCPRCGYETNLKANMRRHFNKQKICRPILEDISIEECLKILIKKEPVCEFCQKTFSRNDNLKRHQETCKTKEIIQTTLIVEELKERITILEEENKRIEKLEEEISKLKRENLNFKTKYESNDDNFIYFLKEREFIKSGESVYKLGRTSNPKNRLSSYPKGSIVLFLSKCKDCKTAENELLSEFRDTFISRLDIGKEYFEGQESIMLGVLQNYLKNNNHIII